MPCWEEGIFPSQRSIDEKGKEGLEEERRLAYVGITRAKKYLNISYASSRQIYGNWQNVIPSRFIDELPVNELEQIFSSQTYQNENYEYSDFDFNQDFEYKSKFNKNSYVNQNIQYVEPSNQLLDNDLSSQLVIGERVFHIKFGYGIVLDINDEKFEVEFDKAGIKRVIGSFLKKEKN